MHGVLLTCHGRPHRCHMPLVQSLAVQRRGKWCVLLQWWVEVCVLLPWLNNALSKLSAGTFSNDDSLCQNAPLVSCRYQCSMLCHHSCVMCSYQPRPTAVQGVAMLEYPLWSLLKYGQQRAWLELIGAASDWWLSPTTCSLQAVCRHLQVATHTCKGHVGVQQSNKAGAMIVVSIGHTGWRQGNQLIIT